MFKAVLTGMFILGAAASSGDVTVKFVESAPKDSFRIVNTGSCATGAIDITIDLSGSQAGLIFDATSQGAGVEVYQPFEIVEGGDRVAKADAVTDGDARTKLALHDLPSGGAVKFTVDVDDTLANSQNGQIRVSGSEIKGARVILDQPSSEATSATFDASGRATVKGPGCPA